MKKILFSLFVVCLLAVACTPAKSDSPLPSAVSAPTATAAQATHAGPTPLAEETRLAGDDAAPAPTEVMDTSCADEDTRKMGEAIAVDYAFTNTDEVLGWFCSGAEFEDIITALETSEQTGIAAGDLLEMLADGLSWDEIWLAIGYTQ
jgi:hypothetical protein